MDGEREAAENAGKGTAKDETGFAWVACRHSCAVADHRIDMSGVQPVYLYLMREKGEFIWSIV